jgi:hypothetical protein
MFYEWKMEEFQRKFLQPKRKKGYRTSTVKMEGPVFSSRGRNGPSMA